MSAPLPLTLFLFCIIIFFFHCCMCNDSSSTTTLQTLKPILPNTSPSPGPSHPSTATIPAFPEQSDVKGCPLTLSDELFDGIKNACGGGGGGGSDMELHRTRCCPVLASWLYSAYSSTALTHSHTHTSSSYEMPLLPDDSETCVNDLENALKVRGIQLKRPNETCDLVFCFCGIRLHPLSCPDAFSVNENGELVGDKTVRRLEKNCISRTNNVNGFPGLGGCSKCLNTLYRLNKKASNSSKVEDRTAKIHDKDCELMGLTWLLAKNTTTYIHTVSGVLRALMLNPDGSNPQSCTLNSDGMPLAVDSSELSDHSTSAKLQAPISSCLLLFCFLLFVQLNVLSF